MPSRSLSSPNSPHHHKTKNRAFLLLIAICVSCLLGVILILVLLGYLYFRFWRREPTLPLDAASAAPGPTPEPARLFSHRELRAATGGFDPGRALGRGASAAVFRGVLPDGKSVAVKQVVPDSAAADREFRNEIHVLGSIPSSPFVVSLLGYCLEAHHCRRRSRQMLVFEYIPGGSLQEALFGAGDGVAVPPVLGWDRRFQIILDVAQALAFLHLECDPPVIHGDIKPSNVLLTSEFRAKISDFGLSRIKDECEIGPEFFSQELWRSQELDVGSPSPVNLPLTVGHNNKISPSVGGHECEKEVAMASSYSPCEDEASCGELGKGSFVHATSPPVDEERMDSNSQWGKDWWWKQDWSGELCSKDYVQEWIASQICPSNNLDWDKERRSSLAMDPIDNSGTLDESHSTELGIDTHKRKLGTKQMKGGNACDKKNKRAREWWKEEYLAEISNKGKCKKGLNRYPKNSCHADNSIVRINKGSKRGLELGIGTSFRKGWKKTRSQSAGSDMWSGDLFSRELSSTMSMRGTVCYIAPEYGGCGHLMEKADIYSFGVLILVIISGRRPLHVLSSPMRLEKANLISWGRQLAQSGNVLELVDEMLKDSYNKDQARLCINLALLCLQRAPELRPDSGDIVKILKGEMELPVIPFEFSPSPQSRLLSKSRRKSPPDAE